MYVEQLRSFFNEGRIEKEKKKITQHLNSNTKKDNLSNTSRQNTNVFGYHPKSKELAQPKPNVQTSQSEKGECNSDEERQMIG